MSSNTMKKILITGSTGFVGRNVLPYLSQIYDVSAPPRSELDLLDAAGVRRYLDKGRFDAIVHLANPTGHNPLDPQDELCERSLRVFAALEQCAPLYGKMIYLGSGAEYGKHRDIAMITEDRFGEEIPQDPYGISRYTMSKLAEARDNIINLRLFACYGPGDPSYKLMPYIIKCIKDNADIELNQDVWFDYLYVGDIFPVLKHFIENPARHGSYNLCSGKRALISDIAKEIKNKMGAGANIIFRKDGLNFEYTASNARLRAELPNWEPRKISEGIREILTKGDY